MDYGLERLEWMDLIDEAPFWGRKLIDTCKSFGPLSFTDAWTLALEHNLWHKHKIRRTVFLKSEIIYRHLLASVDLPDTARWYGDRAYNFALVRTPEFSDYIGREAERIIARINNQPFENLPMPDEAAWERCEQRHEKMRTEWSSLRKRALRAWRAFRVKAGVRTRLRALLGIQARN
jgi:hypothetical protein